MFFVCIQRRECVLWTSQANNPLTPRTLTHRQGAHRNRVFTYGSTILEGIQQRFPSSEVQYHPGVNVDGTWIPGRYEALQKHAADADVIVACVGEHTYAEKPGCV